MFQRVTIATEDLDACSRFYTRVLTTLGHAPRPQDATTLVWEDFAVTAAPRTSATRGLHIGFGAPTRDHVDAFWRAGRAAGHRSDGAPGPRPQYSPDYYGAFLLDAEGNSAEAVHRTGMRTDGVIDHVWIRVADVAAASSFYASLAQVTGWRHRTDEPDHAQFVGETGSLSLVPGPVTSGVRLAFTVDLPHARTLTDPDGNTVDLVSHAAARRAAAAG